MNDTSSQHSFQNSVFNDLGFVRDADDFRNYQMMREQQIAWLAGLLEGEGSFGVRKIGKNKNTTSVRIKLGMTDEDVVLRAAEISGGFSVQKFEPHRGNRKPVYSLAVDGSKAVNVLREILPFMGIRRTAKIKECLDQHDSRFTRSDSMVLRHARKKRCRNTKDLFNNEVQP